MKRFISAALIAISTIMMAGCGQKVEVPPAHVGKIMTKNGYQEGTIGTSKFRLDPCFTYCDKLVTLDQSDKTKAEPLTILMPEDKLNIQVSVQSTLSVNPKKVDALFNTIPPITPEGSDVAKIDWDTIYKTYAQQIIQSETREILSKYSIAHVASNMDAVTAQLRNHLGKVIEQRTPFTVRYVGLANIKYPDIITKAQEGAAQRREQIQQEEAQVQAIDIAMQYIAFGRAYHTSAVLVGAILSALILWSTIKFAKKTEGASLLFNFAHMFTVPIFLVNFKDMLMAWFAPKVWLIMEMTELVKAASK